MAKRDPKYADHPETSSRRELEAEQQREMREGWAGPGLGAATDAQAKGFLAGALVWGAVGLVVFLPLGFIPMGDLPLIGRFLIVAAVGAIAGGTFGAVYLGGREPEREDETRDENGRPSVGSSPRDPNTDDMGHPRS